MSADARPAGSNTGVKIALAVLLLLLVPVAVGLLVIPLLQGQPFESAEELNPDEIRSLRVHLLNREELDGGGDVGPYFAAPEDYARLLAPLRGAREVGQYADARGPFLGEYRVVLESGRKGTIRLYWTSGDGRAAGAVAGVVGGAGAVLYVPPARLRFQVGERNFEGGAAADLIRVAEESAARGRQ